MCTFSINEGFHENYNLYDQQGGSPRFLVFRGFGLSFPPLRPFFSYEASRFFSFCVALPSDYRHLSFSARFRGLGFDVVWSLKKTVFPLVY